MKKIAVLLTCHNRKEKTIESISSLYNALYNYNTRQENKLQEIEVEIFLTDDGCTDGTSDAIRRKFPDKDIKILQGTGSLYWAGGMRFAWKEAIKRHNEWDYYLLLNDDTSLFPEAFEELIKTHEYCKKVYSKSGIYSGITCDPFNYSTITYGGEVFVNKFSCRRIRLGVSSVPQIVDMANANILLVPKEIVDSIGILYEGYIHAAADFDYTYLARKRGYPVLITSNPCGKCERDHKSDDVVERQYLSMSIKSRLDYFKNPIHSSKDYLLLVRRTTPTKYPLTWFFRQLHVFMPQLYFWMNKKR